MCCKENILKGYIELELQLGEVERCRAIYGKYLAFAPHNCTAWRAFAQLESNVGEIPRARLTLPVLYLMHKFNDANCICRAIYELAVSQTELDMPEVCLLFAQSVSV